MGDKVRFPNRVKELRVKRGMSREYVAAMAEMSWSHLLRIESGKVDPSVTKLRDLARVLRCSIDDLVVK